ncbi:Hypothetical predicted protein [Lecanosticta acicola]|uniref:Aminoglycoside phosphotransferase domain-containing protein n=1 Tax=Lecanosticta acicola TaxID=111012 RepID=A0AAI8Z6I6_9PEZI|nr:Hypothetical predicted protein [Lecanosticta acicola]
MTQPKHLAVASEVATLDVARASGVPTPTVYGYSCDAKNAVGAEYILMEHARGRLLGDTWFELSDKQRIALLSQLVENETRLFSAVLPAHGSIFYEKDLPETFRRHAFSVDGISEKLCVGPDVSIRDWFEDRSHIDIRRGSSKTAQEVLEMAALKEIAFLQQYGKPRLPFERVYRDITNFEKSDPQEHITSLENYLEITAQLVPKDEWLHKPTLRHPDLNPNNVFISESQEITSIIDWQHSAALPLFLQLGIPSYFQNYGDPDSENLGKPHLPADLDEWDESDRAKELELYRRRHLHFYYVAATAKKNKPHFNALMYPGGLFRRKIFQHAGEPWEGNSITLKAELIKLTQSWRDIADHAYGSDGPVPPCPLSFDEHEVEKTVEALVRQEEADQGLEFMRNFVGMSTDGWVPNEEYEEAVAKEAEIKKEALACYEDDDPEREMAIEHWPFDDHDENE